MAIEIPFPITEEFVSRYAGKVKVTFPEFNLRRVDQKDVQVKEKSDWEKKNGLLESVEDAIGHTPMIHLSGFCNKHNLNAQICAKLELTNVGGSIKDRAAKGMIDFETKNGQMKKGDFLIEGTSGNTGVAMAMLAARRGLKAIFCMPDKCAREKGDLMRMFGAQVIVTDTNAPINTVDSHIGKAILIQNVINYVGEQNEKNEEMEKNGEDEDVCMSPSPPHDEPPSQQRRRHGNFPRAFNLNQYVHIGNPRAHYNSTGFEILDQMEGKVDVVVIGAGTGGTITGIGFAIKEVLPDCRIVAVEPEGSIQYQEVPNLKDYHSFLVEGIGHNFRPITLNTQVVDEWMQISDKESFVTAREVMITDGIMIGGSCGTALAGAKKIAQRFTDNDKDRRIVVVMPDSCRNYANTLMNDRWMEMQGFTIMTPMPTNKMTMPISMTRWDPFVDCRLFESRPRLCDAFSDCLDGGNSGGRRRRRRRQVVLVQPDVPVRFVAKCADELHTPIVCASGNETGKLFGITNRSLLASQIVCGDLSLNDPIRKGLAKFSFVISHRGMLARDVVREMSLRKSGGSHPDPIALILEEKFFDGQNHPSLVLDTKMANPFFFKSRLDYITFADLAAHLF